MHKKLELSTGLLSVALAPTYGPPNRLLPQTMSLEGEALTERVAAP